MFEITRRSLHSQNITNRKVSFHNFIGKYSAKATQNEQGKEKLEFQQVFAMDLLLFI